MRRIGVLACALAGLSLGACASSTELTARSEQHLVYAQQAARAGDVQQAKKEQKKARYDYQRAAARAYEEERPVPPPPQTPNPLPERVTVF